MADSNIQVESVEQINDNKLKVLAMFGSGSAKRIKKAVGEKAVNNGAKKPRNSFEDACLRKRGFGLLS